jgi:hypothetical protein
LRSKPTGDRLSSHCLSDVFRSEGMAARAGHPARRVILLKRVLQPAGAYGLSSERADARATTDRMGVE